MAETESARAAADVAGKRPRRGVMLSREAIVTAAFELAEREGAAALTMRRLGNELGVDGTAVYRHFRDKDALVLAIGDEVTRWVYEAVAATIDATTSWQDVLRTIAANMWQATLRFPAAFGLVFFRTTGEWAERQMVELILARLQPLGLDADETVRVYRMAIDSLLGLCGIQASFLSLEPRLREKDITAWSRIYAVHAGQDYPATRQHVPALVAITDEQVFDFAVDNLMRGLEDFVRERTTER